MSEYSCIDTGEGYYRCFNAYPTVYPEEAETGLREDPLKSCQYWVRGMSNICSNWSVSEHRCIYRDTYTHIPSRWNNGSCDFLGRSGSCDRYSSTEVQNTNQFICIAPNCFISGLYTPIASGVELRPLDRSEIFGYNELDGVGRCDGFGRGTAISGTDVPVEGVDERGIVCNYYRPWQIGFGSLVPHPVVIKYKDRQRIITQESINAAYDLVGKSLERQLPFDFKIFNLRSKLQKCIYWNYDVGSDFELRQDYNMISVIKYGGNVNNISDHILYNDSLTGSNISPCRCTNSEARPFTTVDFSKQLPSYMMLALIWSADAGTFVCNGAKPECPCYTGEWKYCVDSKMGIGQRITANQMLELRFWSHDWQTQADYEKYWERIPGTNPNDSTTADIYTFTLWRTMAGSDTPMDSIMEGQRVSMCMPSSLFDKRFVSDYMTFEKLIYPKATIDTGTSTPNIQSFPTLIRDLDSDYEFTFQIIYPYVGAQSPFDYEICSENVYGVFIKKSCDIDGDSITVVGSTIRNKKVYVLTPETFNDISSLISLYNSMAIVPDDLWDELDVAIGNAVERYLREKPESIYTTTSDSYTGFFTVGPVNLTYQKLNQLLIVVDYDDGTWDFRKRIVWSQFYGGLIIQKSFSHVYGNGIYNDTQPSYFSPNATLAGSVVSFTGDNALQCSMSINNLFSVYSNTVESLSSIDEYYTYCKKSVTVQDVTVERWGQIPGTSVLWIEINDLNLNYLFEWTISEAKLVSSDPDFDEEIPMSLFYPTNLIEQNTILPNVCMLKPTDNIYRGFFRDDYDLIISYTYEKMDTTSELGEGESISFPVGGFTSSLGVNKNFISPPFDLERTGSDFLISNLGIRRGSPALMVLFSDETGRLISTNATKLCTKVVTNVCRSVAIKYKYESPAVAFRLEPSSGFVTYIDKDVRLDDVKTHYNYPPCGDHLLTKYSERGPMWYPYNACSNSHFYNLVNQANFCVNPMGLVGTAGVDYTTGPAGIIYRDDHRMGCPPAYNAWVSLSGNWLSACGTLWRYYYSYTSNINSTVFTGYVKKRKSVSTAEYLFNGWELPPFGNVDRELVEKWISQDYVSYNVLADNGLSIVTRYEYVPMVIDNMTMYMSFNVLDKDPLDPGMDCFSFTNQMNFALSNNINESIIKEGGSETSARYRFDEIFDMEFHSNCIYPKPVYALSNNTTSVSYYLFKNENHTWAWQEDWRDIERQSGDNRLCFVLYIKPEYKYSKFKEEFRYICGEGYHTIKYTKPILEDGNFVIYPSISIDDGPVRYFEVLYNNYDNSYITWKDEGDGLVGGSSDGNIYELTSSNSWNHNSNTIFDGEAVDNQPDAIAAGRLMIEDYNDLLVPPEQYRYFNRGIIADIRKDRLKYLPYEEVELISEFEFDITTNSEYGGLEYSWNNLSPTLSYTFEENHCLSKILITGHMNVFDTDYLGNNLIACKPGVEVRSKNYPGGILYSSVYEIGTEEELVYYEIEIIFEINPNNMLSYRLDDLEIELSCYNDQYISINSPIITEANYIDKEEIIYVHERKYLVSSAGFVNDKSLMGDLNLNGINTPVTFKQTGDPGANYGGAGVYFPAHYNGISYHDSLNATDKLRSVCSSKAYNEDETVKTVFSTLKKVEKETQGDLYEYTYNLDKYGDISLHSLVMPVKLYNFLQDICSDNTLRGVFSVVAQKLPWENHSLKASYIEHEFWRGLGHKYEWSPDYFTTRCLLFGPVEKVFDATFLHLDTGLGFSATSPLQVHVNKYLAAETWEAWRGY